ncbi:hypothetical protein [Prosthecobacter sp.]|uniref:hypothetical protein n=1 Tax=Prosthecobacter sp. TaxID=1965333 RepID=UPI003784C0EF
MKQKLLAIGSVVFPLLFVAETIALLLMTQNMAPDATIPRHLLPWVLLGMVMLLVTIIGIWFYIVYFMIHAIRNQSLSNGMKAVWATALWCLNIAAIPAYWFMHVRTRR